HRIRGWKRVKSWVVLPAVVDGLDDYRGSRSVIEILDTRCNEHPKTMDVYGFPPRLQRVLFECTFPNDSTIDNLWLSAFLEDQSPGVMLGTGGAGCPAPQVVCLGA